MWISLERLAYNVSFIKQISILLIENFQIKCPLRVLLQWWQPLTQQQRHVCAAATQQWTVSIQRRQQFNTLYAKNIVRLLATLWHIHHWRWRCALEGRWANCMYFHSFELKSQRKQLKFGSIYRKGLPKPSVNWLLLENECLCWQTMPPVVLTLGWRSVPNLDINACILLLTAFNILYGIPGRYFLVGQPQIPGYQTVLHWLRRLEPEPGAENWSKMEPK